MAKNENHILAGVVEKIIFSNQETGYAVARLLPDGGGQSAVIIGFLAGIKEGEHIRSFGSWEENRKFGLQFRVARCEFVPPTSERGIEKYLSSGLIKGIGPVMAERIVRHFGADTLKVIDEQPHRLREVEGIGRKTLKKIAAAWEEHRDQRETMIFMQSCGITPAYAARIIKEYGNSASRILKENPYRLMFDIQGIGFKLADSIAQKMGISKDSPERSAAGLLHILNEMAGEGHVYAPGDHLTAKCSEMLALPTSLIDAGSALLLSNRQIFVESTDGKDAVYLKPLYVAETGVASLLIRLQTSFQLMPAIVTGKAIEWFEKRNRLRFNPGQWQAIEKAINQKLLVITGGPGTGKTTIIRALVEILQAKKQRVQLAAPTGRAAKKMEEAAGIPASTIHRLLEFSPLRMSFVRDHNYPLECDVLIIDETSMLDIALLYHLLKAVPAEASMVFVGDSDQLPSVGPGNVLRDLVESGVVDVARLTEIFRQAEGSLIIDNAHRINRGEEPLFPAEGAGNKSDFHFIERTTPEETASTIEALVADRIPSAFGMDPFVDIQVLSPMHKGTAGVSDLNVRLQRLLNPSSQEITHGDRRFKLGDKVMQTRNNYDKDVYNGDLGLIVSINQESQQVTVDFDGRMVVYEFAELNELEPAYAISIHKSQGSEYRAVVVPVIPQHYILLQRNLIYTAVTRAKELVVLVGSLNALSMAIRNAAMQHRYSRLSVRLMKARK